MKLYRPKFLVLMLIIHPISFCLNSIPLLLPSAFIFYIVTTAIFFFMQSSRLEIMSVLGLSISLSSSTLHMRPNRQMAKGLQTKQVLRRFFFKLWSVAFYWPLRGWWKDILSAITTNMLGKIAFNIMMALTMFWYKDLNQPWFSSIV